MAKASPSLFFVAVAAIQVTTPQPFSRETGEMLLMLILSFFLVAALLVGAAVLLNFGIGNRRRLQRRNGKFNATKAQEVIEIRSSRRLPTLEEEELHPSKKVS